MKKSKEINQHEKEVEKLSEIEERLIKLVSESNNDELMDCFLDWQIQRSVCNEGFNSIFNSIIAIHEKTK